MGEYDTSGKKGTCKNNIDKMSNFLCINFRFLEKYLIINSTFTAQLPNICSRRIYPTIYEEKKAVFNIYFLGTCVYNIFLSKM